MLALLLTGMLTLAFDVQRVKACGTIYVRADGSIDPVTAPISTVDNVTYTFTGNVNDSIVVERDNIVVDGAGYTLQCDGSGTGISLSYRSNVEVKNIGIDAFYYGIRLWASSNNTISENNITNNYHGILLDYSSDYNTISGNNVTANCHDGVGLSYYSNYNKISDNSITKNGYGVRLYESSNYNCVSGNNVTSSRYGISLSRCLNDTVSGNNIAHNEAGINLLGSSKITASENQMTKNEYGIWLEGSDEITVSRNSITNNDYGIGLGICYYNSIHHNSFINNTDQVYDFSWDHPSIPPSINVWDDGYPSGGNYWSSYNGTDVYSGPYQNETGSDGMRDTPYIINENNTDNYPLMKPYPWSPHDVGITNVKASKTVVGEGYRMHFNVTVFNYGAYAENFNVSVYANTTNIGTFTDITLAGKTSIIVTINCTEVNIAKGNYSISAYINPVPDEEDTTDNTYRDGIVRVTIPGDVDGDFDVDRYDAAGLLVCYGAKEVSSSYDANCDIDGDGDVDLYDAVILLIHY